MSGRDNRGFPPLPPVAAGRGRPQARISRRGPAWCRRPNARSGPGRCRWNWCPRARSSSGCGPAGPASRGSTRPPLFSAAGWGKPELRQFLFDYAVRTRAELAAAGKEAVSSRTRWRLPADHPDALPLAADDGAIRVLNSPAAVLVVVAGAGNAGVSAVVETFGPRGGPPPVTRVSFGAPLCRRRTNGWPARRRRATARTRPPR